MTNGRSGSRAPGLRCAQALALSLLALAAAMLGAGSAAARTATPFSYGLPAHVPAPRWAQGRDVHFYPARTSNEAGAVEPGSPRQNSDQGAEGALGRRCGGCLGVPLRYYGGPVQHEPEVHVIFWGSNWNSATGPLLHEELMRFYEGLASSPSGLAFQGILTQYFDESGRVAAALAPQRLSSFTDESVRAPVRVSDASLRAEAKAVAENPENHWTLGPNAEFVIVPAPGASYEAGFDQDFCAYHSDVREHATDWTYTFLSYNGEEPFERGCLDYDGDETASHAEKAARVLSMDASHEYAESATDPTFGAWLDQQGNELADICSSGDDELANHAWVQGLWDDHLGACSLGDAQPPHVLGLTEAATAVGQSDATLNATVNPENEGLEARYRFEYGPTTSYGQSAPAGLLSAGSALSNQQVHQTISGLTQGSTYHYRVVATNTREGLQETTFGEDHSLVASPWATAEARPLTAGQASFGSALLSCSFVPWSCGGVSCPARSSCVAVGAYEVDGGELPMAETWLDGQWSFQALPFPPQTGEQDAPTGVSCAGEGACLSVGYERNSSGIRVPVADRLSAGAWSVSPIGLPSGATEAGLEGISCSSASECMGVGLKVTGSGSERPYAALWRNGTWTVSAVRSPEAANAVLEGISCPSQSSCVAVGLSESAGGAKAALAESWNGTAWTLTTPGTPSGAASSVLSAVSCSSPGECIAVGSSSAGARESSLAELWNGAAWSLQATAGGAGQEELLGVSCPAAGECTAVGDHAQGAHSLAMVQIWNGAGWSAQASNVDEAQASELHAVSCASGSTCAAAGIIGWSAQARSRSGGVEPLAEIRSAGPHPGGGNPVSSGNPQPPPLQGATEAAPLGAVLLPELGLTATSEKQTRAPRCSVPRLSGVSLARARSRLHLAHCLLGHVHRPRHPRGALVVLRQGHSPGASLAANARIDVMLGPPPRAAGRRR